MTAAELIALLELMPPESTVEFVCTDGPGFSWLEVNEGNAGKRGARQIVDDEGTWVTYMPTRLRGEAR